MRHSLRRLRLLNTITLLAELRSIGIKVPQQRDQFARPDSICQILLREGLAVRLRRRTKAPVAAAVKRRTQHAATGLRDRSQTGTVLRDGHTHNPLPFAVQAEAVSRCPGTLPPDQRNHHFHKLMTVDRTPAEFKIDGDMVRD